MGRCFWRDWIAANALSEPLGLGVAAVIAVVIFTFGVFCLLPASIPRFAIAIPVLWDRGSGL